MHLSARTHAVAPFLEKPVLTESKGGLQIICSPQDTQQQTCF